MIDRTLLVCISLLLTFNIGKGQTSILDSCGVDNRPELNQYEIKVIDSLFIPPHTIEKYSTIDRKNAFDFSGKKIAFFSCTNDSNTKGKGLLSKMEFFEFCKPTFKG